MRVVRHTPLLGRLAQPILINVMVDVGVVTDRDRILPRRKFRFNYYRSGVSRHHDAAETEVGTLWPALLALEHIHADVAASLVDAVNEYGELSVWSLGKTCGCEEAEDQER